MSIVAEIVSHIRPYTGQIAFALVVTTLILFSGAINTFVRNLVKSWNVVFRVLVFILLCAVGYGFLAAWLTGFLHGQLRDLSSLIYLLVVSGAFIVLGVLAERNRWR